MPIPQYDSTITDRPNGLSMESTKKSGASCQELHANDREGLSESSGEMETAAAKRVHDAATLSDSGLGHR